MLFGALDKVNIVHKQHPHSNPYAYVSTVVSSIHPNSRPAVTADYAIQEFDHGIIIGAFEFYGKKDWTDKAKTVLSLINTGLLYDFTKKAIGDDNRLGFVGSKENIKKNIIAALNKHSDTFKKVFFKEELQQAGNDQQLFTKALFTKQLQGYSILGTILLGLRYENCAFLMQCELSSSSESLVHFAYQNALLHFAEPFGSPPLKDSYMMCTKGIHVPIDKKDIIMAQSQQDLALSIEVLAEQAMEQKWYYEDVKNPLVIGINNNRLKEVLFTKKK